MQAKSTTETGLNIIFRPGVPLGISGTEGGPAPCGPRRSGAGTRVARLLEAAVIATAALTIALGIGLVAYGATLILTGQDATPRPFPNSQHISTTPNPRR